MLHKLDIIFCILDMRELEVQGQLSALSEIPEI